MATEAYILVGALRLKAPGVFDRAAIVETAGSSPPALAMVPVLLAARSTPLAVQVLLGAATYPIALLLFRAVGLDEIRRLYASSPLGRRRHVPEPTD